MSKITGLNFLFGIFLTGSTVVADDVNFATGQHASADLIRRFSINSSSSASATEAASATTAGTNQLSTILSTIALPPLPSGVSELKFSEFFRQPIGPRSLEYTEKLRSLEGWRIRILGYMVRQEQPADHCLLLSPVAVTLPEREHEICAGRSLLLHRGSGSVAGFRP